jgi:hypothetical protein
MASTLSSYIPKPIRHWNARRLFLSIAFAYIFAVIELACQPAEMRQLPKPGANASDITVLTTPAGARVTIDGLPVGTSPQKVRLNPGPHHFKASLNGYFPVEQKFSISAKKAKEIHLTLVASH